VWIAHSLHYAVHVQPKPQAVDYFALRTLYHHSHRTPSDRNIWFGSSHALL